MHKNHWVSVSTFAQKVLSHYCRKCGTWPTGSDFNRTWMCTDIVCINGCARKGGEELIAKAERGETLRTAGA